MELTRCSKADYEEIISQIQDFWGSDRTLALHHPMFINEFGDSAFVFKDRGIVAAYLFGYLSQTAPAAYVHLVGVRAAFRRQGLARRLYEHFVEFALSRGCSELKAITTPGNQQSILFHRAFGMECQGQPNRDGVIVVTDYAGAGQDRVVFVKKLQPASTA